MACTNVVVLRFLSLPLSGKCLLKHVRDSREYGASAPLCLHFVFLLSQITSVLRMVWPGRSSTYPLLLATDISVLCFAMAIRLHSNHEAACWNGE